MPSGETEVPCPTGVWLSSTPYPACFIGFFSEPVEFPYLPKPAPVKAKREQLPFLAACKLDDEYNALRDTVMQAKLYRNKFHVGYPYVAALIPSITERQWSIIRGMVDFLWYQQTPDEVFSGDSMHLNDAGLRASGDHSLARDLHFASVWTEEQQVRALGWVWTYRAQLETRRAKRGAIRGNKGAVLLGWVIPR